MNNHRITIQIGTLADDHALVVAASMSFETQDVEAPYPVLFSVPAKKLGLDTSGSFLYKFIFDGAMIRFVKKNDKGEEVYDTVYAKYEKLKPHEQAYTTIHDKNGVVAILEVEQLFEQVTHPDGLTCGECKFFDHKTGRKMLTKHTNEFTNGSYGLLEVVCMHQAERAGSRNFSPNTVGYCAPQRLLADEDSPACEKEFQPKEK